VIKRILPFLASKREDSSSSKCRFSQRALRMNEKCAKIIQKWLVRSKDMGRHRVGGEIWELVPREQQIEGT